MKYFLSCILVVFFLNTKAQLFDNERNAQLVKKSVDFIYNQQMDSARYYRDQVMLALPRHPVVPMLRAMELLWENIPIITVDSVFERFQYHLQQVILLANALDHGNQSDPEAIFFEMAARGLLAEYYADDGQYMRAVSEATKTYGLLKKGFELVEVIPDFYMTSGIYNYFREKYPERHPVYKPFMWFFKEGDVQLGLKQLRKAAEKSVLSNVESIVYLSYIYLRYEYQPAHAQRYLVTLNRTYPNNPYIKAKLLESFTIGNDFRKVSKPMIDELIAIKRPYYQLAGYTFLGLYEEKVSGNLSEAVKCYNNGISASTDIKDHGEYYRSLSFLGLGRIHHQQGKMKEAEFYLKRALDYAETKDIKDEAERLLDAI